MEASIKRHVETLLRGYPKVDWAIKNREREIMHPYNPDHDDNVGGGKSNIVDADGVSRDAIALATDPRLRGLEFERQCVEITLHRSDDLTRTIISERYFKNGSNDLYLANELNVTRTAVNRHRNKFLDQLASELGWI